MISPEEFKRRWDTSFYGLVEYDENDIRILNLPEESKTFLVQAGLPKSAAPYLSFKSSTKGGGMKLDKIFNLRDKKFSKYIFLGSTGTGDLVCLVEDKGEIIYLDHENYREYFINSSLNQLAEYLLLYSEFIKAIKQVNGDEAYLEGNAPDKLYFELIDKFKIIDSKALNDKCFWQEELNHYKK
ncbi:MAG TPA: SUKH-4 family immunity protein [Pseudobacteroides sp.]|nr:SUKH-4 family immunity protein [Pseudobacteroides sp.]